MTLLAATAHFCGWDPDTRPTDDVSPQELWGFVRERWPEYRQRVFRVNDESETCTALEYVRCNAEDPYILYVASTLTVGEKWDDYHCNLVREM